MWLSPATFVDFTREVNLSHFLREGIGKTLNSDQVGKVCCAMGNLRPEVPDSLIFSDLILSVSYSAHVEYFISCKMINSFQFPFPKSVSKSGSGVNCVELKPASAQHRRANDPFAQQVKVRSSVVE